MSSEKYADFNQWYASEYTGRHTWEDEDGDGSGYLEIGKGFFDSVQKSKKGIRKYLGEIEKSGEVQIEDGEKPLSTSDFEKYVKPLAAMVPDFNYYISANYNSTIESFKSSSIRVNNHNYMKSTKVLSTMFSRTYGVSESDKRKFEKALSELGQAYSKNRTKKETYQVTLDTSIYGFIKLGTYGIDDDSCFGPDGCNEHHKYRLAQTEKTFILRINDAKGLNARAWGFANEDYTIFNVCNFYLAPKAKEGNIIEVTRKFFCDLTQMDLKITNDMIDIDQNDLYHNEYGSISLAEEAVEEDQMLEVNTSLDASYSYTGDRA